MTLTMTLRPAGIRDSVRGAVALLKRVRGWIRATRHGRTVTLTIYALLIWLDLRRGRICQRSPLAEMANRWHDPGVIALGPIRLGRLVKPVSGSPPADPPTLTSVEK